MATPQARRAPTRDRLIEAARRLFWEKGYGETGLAEILEGARANSGSFYYFFESKEELLRTVLKTYLDLLDPQVVRPVVRAVKDPVDRVFALLAAYRRRLEETDCRYGCPIGRLALELDTENTEAHRLIAENFAAWRRAVEGQLQEAGLPGAADLAALVLAVMEGGVMQSRSERSLEPFDAAVRELRARIETLRSPRKKRKRRK